MTIDGVFWNENNEDHVKAHQVEPFEVGEVLVSRKTRFLRYSGKRYYALGSTWGGRYLLVVLDDEGGGWVYPVTARDMTRRERKLYQRLFRKGRKK